MFLSDLTDTQRPSLTLLLILLLLILLLLPLIVAAATIAAAADTADAAAAAAATNGNRTAHGTFLSIQLTYGTELSTSCTTKHYAYIHFLY